MTGHRLYLDHNATTPLRPEARSAMIAALDGLGAPSSGHSEGRGARALVEQAREQVAALVGAKARGVIFTSGATEANNMALCPAWQRAGAPFLDRCVISAIEHASVLKGVRFSPSKLETRPVDGDGRIDSQAFVQPAGPSGDHPLPFMASVMLANNETGVVQPVAEIAQRVHAAGGLVHSDAAQAAGKIPVSMAKLGVDLLTVSSHKLGGPMGAGALVLASEDVHLAEPLIRGGGQERGARAGTENVAAIAGFGAAAQAAARDLQSESARQRGLRDWLETELRAIAPNVVIFGDGAERLPNTSCFAVPGLAADIALIRLDLDGFSVSSGSACASGKVAPSHVLAAMGVEPELARCALRVSLGRTTTRDDIGAFLAAFHRLVESLHQKSVSAA